MLFGRDRRVVPFISRVDRFAHPPVSVCPAPFGPRRSPRCQRSLGFFKGKKLAAPAPPLLTWQQGLPLRRRHRCVCVACACVASLSLATSPRQKNGRAGWERGTTKKKVKGLFRCTPRSFFLSAPPSPTQQHTHTHSSIMASVTAYIEEKDLAAKVRQEGRTGGGRPRVFLARRWPPWAALPLPALCGAALPPARSPRAQRLHASMRRKGGAGVWRAGRWRDRRGGSVARGCDFFWSALSRPPPLPPPPTQVESAVNEAVRARPDEPLSFLVSGGRGRGRGAAGREGGVSFLFPPRGVAPPPLPPALLPPPFPRPPSRRGRHALTGSQCGD